MTLTKLQVAVAMVFNASAVLAQSALPEPAPRVEPATDLPVPAAPRYEPMTLSRRYEWAAWSVVSPQRLAGNVVSSAISTWRNRPPEYGPHWEGYGKRIGMRLAAGSTGTFMEASIGALWDEDPRYVRAAGRPFRARLSNVLKMTFMARNRNGDSVPAYARYISVPMNSYMSNAFRADGEADARHAAIRIPMSFLSRAIGNTFTEFWPDATKRLRRE